MKKLFLMALGVTILVGASAAHADWYRGRYYSGWHGGWHTGWRGPGWGYYPRPYRYYVPPPVYNAPAPPVYYPPPVYYSRPHYPRY
jgi:hypothetical protein